MEMVVCLWCSSSTASSFQPPPPPPPFLLLPHPPPPHPPPSNLSPLPVHRRISSNPSPLKQDHLPAPRREQHSLPWITLQALSTTNHTKSQTPSPPGDGAPPPPEENGRVRRWLTACALVLAFVLQPGQGPAYAFDWFGGSPSIEKDPVEPFTIYGSIFKKFFIEKIVDGKVVSRKKGFTATSCVNTLDASKETPELQGIPAGLKVLISGEPVCARGEGPTKEESCIPPCRRACAAAISRHSAEIRDDTGYMLDTKDEEKVTNSCSSQCSNECLKPGKTISFIYPFRPSR